MTFEASSTDCLRSFAAVFSLEVVDSEWLGFSLDVLAEGGVRGSKVCSVTESNTLPARMISGTPFCEAAEVEETVRFYLS